MDNSPILKDLETANVLRTIDPDKLAEIETWALNRQTVRKNDVYFSRVRFQYTISTSGSPATGVATIAAGTTWQAFQYGRGDVMTVAGFASGFGVAQLQDTSINTKGETNNQELFVIQGLGVSVMPTADPLLVQALFPELYMSIGFNGDTNTYKLGSPLFWPGGGGLVNGGLSSWTTANLYDSAAIIPGSPSNGLQGAFNYRSLPDSVSWFPKGGGSDSNFAVNFAAPRAVTLSQLGRVAASGIAAQTPPTASGTNGGNANTYVDVVVALFGTQFAPRSKNR